MKKIISTLLKNREGKFSEEDLAQSSLTISFMGLTTLVSLIFLVITLGQGFQEGVYATAFAFISCLILISLYKWTLVPHKVLVTIYCLVILTGMFVMVIYSGGLTKHSILLPWFAFSPIVPALLTGKKTSLVMIAVCCLSFIVFLSLPDHFTPNHWVTGYPKLLLFMLYFILTILIGLSFYLFKKNETALNSELQILFNQLNEQKNKLEQKSQLLEKTFSELKVKNKKIVDSIEYAKYIQNAVMPTKEKRNSLLPECFYFYKPKDVVSGDFFWIEEKDGIVYFAVVDCTGHGVPGALLSVLGNNILSTILDSGLTVPGAILSELHAKVKTTLQQDQTDNRDGMDITLCKWDKTKKVLFYSGAKNPLIYVTDNGIEKIKADRCSIGGVVSEKHENFSFNTQEIHIKESSMVYMFSDGYQDQFGGENNKKFSQRRMRQLFENEHLKPVEEQYDVFSKAFKEWKGTEDQIDDVLLIGVRLDPA